MKDLVIEHGVPDNPGYFLISRPYRGQPMGDLVKLGPEFDDPWVEATLKNPKTGETVDVEIHNMIRLEVMGDGAIIDFYAKLTYGINGSKLIEYMRTNYHISIEKIEFILCKKI